MCVATGLAYLIVPIIYFEEAAAFDPEHFTLPKGDLPKLLEDLAIGDVFIILSWTAEFMVKISLLLFFRLLVKRLKRLTLYVRFVLGYTTVVWAYLVVESFIICPYFGYKYLSKFATGLIGQILRC